ncbi:hypothetical protein N9S20_01520 [Candidatus Pelagibacter sp.]|nr:hypothetical protein [Candidatus Pelagibacter sp.]
MLKKYLIYLIKNFFSEEIEKELILKAKILSIKNQYKKRIKNISEVEFQVFSQWGEDGIIDWIIDKFPEIPKSFLEIGTQDYKESNTRFLLTNRNWDGFLIEGDKNAVKNIKSQRVYWKHNLKVKNIFITKKNINTVIQKFNVPKKLGLLSMDIDGIDYWALKELSVLNPSIIICEYNALFGLKKSITVPYKENFIRSKEHYSNLYYGASIQAFIDVLKKKKYHLVGTNSAGNNAFFIKDNFMRKTNKIILKNKIFSSKFRESRNKKYKLNYLGKKRSLKLIENKKIVDLDTNTVKRLCDLKL